MRSFSILLFALLVGFSGLSEAKKDRGYRDNDNQQAGQVSKDDADLVRAVRDRRNLRFIEASELTVSRLLSDDTKGLPHQRWYVRLSNGQEVFCVYNLDMGRKIPLKIGDKVAVGGEFKWTDMGALVHWLHYDPKNQRPDGYVEHEGVRYGVQ